MPIEYSGKSSKKKCKVMSKTTKPTNSNSVNMFNNLVSSYETQLSLHEARHKDMMNELMLYKTLADKLSSTENKSTSALSDKFAEIEKKLADIKKIKTPALKSKPVTVTTSKKINTVKGKWR